jgi:hypothetical protein
MNPVLAFAFGVLFSFVICGGLAGLYYARARRRVASIKAAIIRQQQAAQVVGRACDRAYPTSQS